MKTAHQLAAAGIRMGKRLVSKLSPQIFISKRAALVVSLVVSAGLMAAAIGSADYSWACWISLLPLLVCIRSMAPIQAMACGALWGGSVFLFSATVIDTPIPVALHSLLLLAAISGGYAYVGALFTRRFGYSMLFLSVAWIGVELALTPLSLHKGLLAGAQPGGHCVHLVESLLGYVWVSFLVAYINTALLSVLTFVLLKAGGASRSTHPAGGSPPRLLPLQACKFLCHHLIHSLQARAPPLA